MYIAISNPGYVVFTNKFVPGDKAMSMKFVHFCDGTDHHAGYVYDVTIDNVSYYNVFHKDYEKVENVP